MLTVVHSRQFVYQRFNTCLIYGRSSEGRGRLFKNMEAIKVVYMKLGFIVSSGYLQRSLKPGT